MLKFVKGTIIYCNGLYFNALHSYSKISLFLNRAHFPDRPAGFVSQCALKSVPKAKTGKNCISDIPHL